MRTLIVGDVHGCAARLDKLLRKARPDRLILVGDLFTKGPDPVGVWEILRAWDAESVMGNHDLEVLQGWRPGRPLPKEAHAWLRERPAWLELPGIIVVHAAVHPEGLEHTTLAIASGQRPVKGKRSWQKQWRGEELVVHGHEAKRGLVDRRPYTLGLDTGCVIGGRLTGYLVEEDKLISVKGWRP